MEQIYSSPWDSLYLVPLFYLTKEATFLFFQHLASCISLLYRGWSQLLYIAALSSYIEGIGRSQEVLILAAVVNLIGRVKVGQEGVYVLCANNNTRLAMLTNNMNIRNRAKGLLASACVNNLAPSPPPPHYLPTLALFGHLLAYLSHTLFIRLLPIWMDYWPFV